VVGVVVGVAFGDLFVPPGVICFEPVLCPGAGSGSVVPGVALGVADEPGLGCGRVGVLALGLGWVLAIGGVVCAGARRTASARSMGMPAGCWARPPTWLAVRVLGGSAPAAVVVGAGLLAAAKDVQGFVVAWRVPCTPVSSMLIAP